MKLNTTSQHAIRIMTYITKHSEKEFHNAKDISEQLDIPYKYLTKVMTQLVSANILMSTKGREGGYFLTQKADTIKIIDILNAVNESLHDTSCILGSSTCNPEKKCVLHDQWARPKNSIITMFTNTTLSDIHKGNYKI